MPARKNRQPFRHLMGRMLLWPVMCLVVSPAGAAPRTEVKRATEALRELAMQSFTEGERFRAEWQKQLLHMAVDKYMEAYSRWMSAGSRREAARALEAAGETHFILSEYRPALAAYGEALEIRRATKDRLGIIETLNDIGYTYTYLGQNEEALSYLKQAKSRLDKLRATDEADERTRIEAQLMNNMGEVYYSLSDVKNALDCFKRSLALWTAVGDRKGEALAQLNLGYMDSNFGDLKSASERYDRSLSLWLSIGDRRGEAYSRTAMGGVRSFLGEQQAALDLHNEALNIFRSIGDREGEAATLNGIGTAYQGLNKPQEALDNYERAMRLYHDIGNLDFEALAKVYIAAVHRAAGATGQALDYYNESLSLLRKVGDRRVATYVLKDLAKIYGSLGQTRRALDEYDKVLKLYEEFEDRRGQADTLNSIADIYYSSGRARRALGLYQRSLSLSQEAQDSGAEITTSYKLARAERDLGDVTQALSRMDGTIRLLEGLRVKAGGPDRRAAYFASVHTHYELYADLLMDMHKRHPDGDFASEALYASERSRARSLLEMLAEAKVDIRRGADPKLVELADSLVRLLDAKGEYQIRVLSGSHSPGDVEELDKEIRGIEGQYEEVQAQILKQSSLYLTLTQPKLLRLKDIQAELKGSDTVLLEYALGEERSYLWAVTSESFTSYELPGRTTLEDAAREVYGLLTARQPADDDDQSRYEERIATADAQYAPKALRLSEMLLGQAADQLGNKRLIIIADGALQYIPFEALPLPSPGRRGRESSSAGEPDSPENVTTLVAEHEVVYMQSASMLSALRRKRSLPESSRKGVAIMADPVFGKDDPRLQPEAGQEAGAEGGGVAGSQQSLQELGEEGGGTHLSRLPSTLHEADMIVESAPRGTTMVAAGFQANKSAAMSAEFGRYKILHFATHGVINNKHPMLSGVALSSVDERGNARSGFLRLPDIYQLDLSAELVVLSACNSALGRQMSGEGFIGLTRGFMYAGSSSVLASLWKVDDEATAELMGNFYRAMLQDGLPPATALQKAKQRMQAHPKWHHPFYWAAFVVQGEYREPIKINGPGFIDALPLAAVAAALAAVIIYSMRRVRRSRGEKGGGSRGEAESVL